MKSTIRWFGLMSLAACGTEASAAPATAPRGATVGPTGFATIDEVPPSPFPDRLPPPENRPNEEAGYYARLAGISDSEARRRLAQQQAARPEFERLIGLLRTREKDNFTDARMVHKPGWAYVFYFKRAPEQTLAKYTRNPNFKAALARYSRQELRAIAQPWIERLSRHRLLGGHGTDATYGEVGVDLVVSEAEFRAIAKREGWQLPAAIKLRFSEAVEGPALAAAVRPFVRIFAQSDRALGPTNQALLSGRIVLRDGCLYVTGPNQPDRLAYFAREVAIGLDDAGYMALATRGAVPRHLGRIGEPFSWGGPIGVSETLPMVAELRSRCGQAPLVHVGVPQSARLFNVRPWVIDAIAERRRISREEAWRRFRACLEDREARKAEVLLSCDTL